MSRLARLLSLAIALRIAGWIGLIVLGVVMGIIGGLRS